ncbi:hypothetical protein OE88DRAFT_1774025 [Heliocybe sulcata]|uniref:Fungal-type protein kinase domain-containing protein n=1 Tax=Heliocybe sulcata TaxID=5364 RepID=A0A5C3MNW3_9AGAM|nr:hypothetical protein OE88DRAFT_1774025 [Heliocybe sulcata]
MKKNLKKHQLQLASYAREIFVQQPTRRFVYGLLVSEQTIQLYQFDRGGVIYSSKYDIRDDAETFVQIFLAVATEDEIALGLGKHIFWAPDGKCYFDPKGKMNRVYAVVTSEKPFRRAAIRGRCTTCWRVEDDQKNQFLLKFAWRAMGRVKESVFLKAVKEANLQHVGLMERSRTIETLYCVRSYMPLIAVNGRGERFPVPDRAHHWLLEPWYGPTLDQFESPLELLEGFYDAITGKPELLSIGILHRDISISNIVFDRRPDADTFAKLIDMDMAIRLDRTKSGVKTDVRTGTRAFQSLKVLSGIGQHDHLDELEFLFWVFCYIVFSYDAPGKLKKKPETCLQGFQSSKPAQAIDAKKLVLWNAELPRKVSIGLGAGTPALFRKLQLFFLKVTEDTRKKIDSRGYKATNDIYEEIMGAAGLSTAQGPELVLPSVSDEDTNVWLKKEALQHYQLVLNLVRESIDLTRRYMDGALLWKQVGADDENMEGETRVEEPNLDDHSDEGFSDASDVVGEASWEGEAGYTVPAAGVTSHSSGYSNKRSASQSFDVEDDVSMEPSTSRATKRAKGSHSRRK